MKKTLAALALAIASIGLVAPAQAQTTVQHIPHGHAYGWLRHHHLNCVVKIPGVDYWHGTVFCPSSVPTPKPPKPFVLSSVWSTYHIAPSQPSPFKHD